MHMHKLATALALTALVASGSAGGAELKVLITTAMKAAIDDLGPQFEKASGHTLRITYGPSGALAKRVADGEGVDLIVIAGGVEDLIKQGKVAPDSRTDVARVRIGVAVRKGAPKPDIGTIDAFKRTLVAAKSIAYVDPAAGGASGIYLARMLERIGLLAEVNAKAKLARGGTEDMVSAIVARGDAEIGLQQISEIMSVPGADLVGPLPDELQTVTIYTVGVPASAKEAAAAKALVAFLTAGAATPVYKAKGLDPG
jgi:molybdate transport system substrate-binding protein